MLGKINGTEENNWSLTPLTTNDMKRYATEDVEDWYKKHGKNTTKLGGEMTDDEFQQHHRIEEQQEDEVHVRGYGVMSRPFAKKQAIRKCLEIAEHLSKGRDVPLHYFDLAKDFYEASME